MNVGGSVSFSTAQYLRLFDGVNSGNFYANPASDGLANSVLAVAPVVDFGFLSPVAAAYGFLTAPDPTATITVHGSNLSIPSALPDTPPNSISLVGGKVVIEGGAQFSAPSGRVHLATTASPGEFAALPGESLANATSLQSVPNNPVNPASATSFTSYGLMSLASNSSIDVHGTSTVFIKGGQLVLSVNDATLSTTESPTVPGTTDTISLSQGSSIVTSNAGADPGADVQLLASNVQLDEASIQSLTSGDGHGGNISITDTQSVILTNGAQVVSDTKGGGNGGNITIATTSAPNSSVTISGFDSTFTLGGVVHPLLGVVSSGAFSTASAGGAGGHISVTAPIVTLDSMGSLVTINTGSGNGGSIAINALSVNVTNAASILSTTGIDWSTQFFPAGPGNGGTVNIRGLQGAGSTADSVTFNNGGSITTMTFGPGQGGDVHLAAGTTTFDAGAVTSITVGEGNGGKIALDAGTLLLSTGAGISTQTAGPGHGGDVTITASSIAMETVGNVLSMSTGDLGDGLGGNITLNVDGLSLASGATIQSLISNPGTGRGGNVTVQGLQGEGTAAESVSLTGGSSFTTQTSVGSAEGGQLFVAAKSVSMDAAGIGSITSGNGAGGNVLMAVQNLSLSNGATISGSTGSNDVNLAPAGNITVQGLDDAGSFAESVTLSGQGTALQMTALGVGHLGNIQVSAKTLKLTDGAAISAGTSIDTGTAGDVTIKAESVNISGGSSITSQAFAAPAGPVTVSAERLTMDQGSIVTSTGSLFPGGDGGNVVINVGTVSLINASSIKSETSGIGKGGDITMHGDSLTLANSQISSASTRSTVISNARRNY